MLQKLQQQNRVLRIRETMQLETLEGAEMAIHYMGSLAQEATSSQQIMQCLLPAVVLDMQALELKQALQPPPQLHLQLPPNCPAVTTQEAHALLASAFATVQAAHAAVAQSGAVSGSSSGSGSSDASETAWSGGPVGPSARRMQRLMATLTPEEVQEARALTLQGVAGKAGWCLGGGYSKLPPHVPHAPAFHHYHHHHHRRHLHCGLHGLAVPITLPLTVFLRPAGCVRVSIALLSNVRHEMIEAASWPGCDVLWHLPLPPPILNLQHTYGNAAHTYAPLTRLSPLLPTTFLRPQSVSGTLSPC